MKTVDITHFEPPETGVPSRLEVEDKAHSGGEASVYFSRDGRFAVKIYHKYDENKTHKQRKLQQISSVFRGLSAEQAQFMLPPLALVTQFEGQPRVGFVMRRVPRPPFCELAELIQSPKLASRYFQQGRTWADYLALSRSVAHCVSVLHGKGCDHGDIHYRNFMANIETGEAVMLELDGIIIKGFLRAEVMGMMGFMAPELLPDKPAGKPAEKNAPDMRTDCHSLAVLTLHALLLRNPMKPQVEYAQELPVSAALGYGKYAAFSEHPIDKRNLPAGLGKPLYSQGVLSYKMLPPRLQRLTESALLVNLRRPTERPSAKIWEDALALTQDELVACEHCGQHFPYPYWQSGQTPCCCFCGAKVQTAPLLLRLFEEGRHWEYRFLDRTLVLARHTALHADSAYKRHSVPLHARDRARIGWVDWDAHSNCFALQNESDDTWTVRPLRGGSARKARRGESLPVHQGDAVQFGTEQRIGLVM